MVIAADEARRALVDQHAGDADVLAFPQQVVRIAELAGQDHQVGDRREGDVAFAEVELELEFAVRVFEHRAFGLDARGVGAGGGFG
jgi:hypothetical protein